ncbi:hypothetical protein HELRODRAFT_167052 [Helobdella robusta]|uniref:Uncharacterized protein n=1 Tax=Helobdella robusta TaxID=6412 RepID=T1EYY2_HELRO|nr:hypothetical protein HELRODRAFT_167052 [Helobdella robusta]ESO10550.1 hypothetical protein HELRODRAFT_167052 [Helobdella robusta]
MSKRKNPFREVDSAIQVKMCVSQKFLDEKSDEKMQKVYEKTKQLLFAGSKNAFTLTTTTNNDENTMEFAEGMQENLNESSLTNKQTDSHTKDISNSTCFRQLTFSSNGQLSVGQAIWSERNGDKILNMTVVFVFPANKIFQKMVQVTNVHTVLGAAFLSALIVLGAVYCVMTSSATYVHI